MVLTHHNITAAFSSFLLLMLFPPTGVLLQGALSSAGHCHHRASPSSRCWTFSEVHQLNALREIVLHRAAVSWDRSRALPKGLTKFRQENRKMGAVVPPGWCATHVSDLGRAAHWQPPVTPVINLVSDDYFYLPCRHHNWKGRWRRVNLWSHLWRYVSSAILLCKWQISAKIKLLIWSYSQNNLGIAFHLPKTEVLAFQSELLSACISLSRLL